jgi:hypothetical protein
LSDRYATAWSAARPYMRARKNDVHVPLSFWYAERLLDRHPEADADVVLLAIMFHDTGWAVIDEDRIFREGFATGDQEVDLSSDVRILHEKKGARLAAEALGGEWDPAVVEEVVAIIDGHDSRPQALSRNDELVKDADKLWRYSVTGLAVSCDWFAMTPGQYATRLERQVREALFTDAAREIGARDLAQSRAILQTDVLS